MAKKKSATKSTRVAADAQEESVLISPGWALVWVALAAVWVLLMASMLSHDPMDPPSPVFGIPNEPPANWVGTVGAFVAYEVYLMFGPGAWVLMAGLTAGLYLLATKRLIDQPVLRGVGVLVVAVAASGLLLLAVPDLVVALGIVTPVGPGGLVATFLVDQLLERFATMGTVVILGVLFVVGLLVAADSLVFAVPRMLAGGVERVSGFSFPRPSLAGLPGFGGAGSRPGKHETPVRQPAKAGRKTRKKASTKVAVSEEEWIDEDAGGLGGVETFDPEKHTASEEDEWEYEEEVDDAEVEYVDEDGNPIDPSEMDGYAWEEEGEADEEYEYEDAEEVGAADDEEWDEDEDGAPAAYIAEKREFTPEELRDKIKTLPINFANKSSNTQMDLPREVDLSGYEYPSLELLDEWEDNESEKRLELVREQGAVLAASMNEYGIQGEVVGIDTGPTITMYEVRLAPGTKVASLSRIASDLARSLKAHNIRIVPNIEGKDTVGVEVPNLERETVALRDLMSASGDKSKKMVLPMWMGKDASGQPLLFDLNTMPHMLIAGTTGSGKSVCMNTIIMSLLFTKRPDELKMVLVDPKMVEMAMYKDIPHLMCPVVTEMGKAAAILEWAVTKMDERYELLAEAGVRNIQGYNQLGEEELKERLEPNSDEEWARIPKKLPYLVFIIDELADLMMTNKEVEAHIVRIAQKARAVGMHLILATQRPQANVVTGLIKGNMPCRVSFRVASKLDSRIVLDQGGAELLLGHGDMLFLNPKTSKVSRCQGTFIDDTEIRRSVKFLKTVAAPSFEPSLVQIKSANLADDEQERDPEFDKAVEIVLDSQRGSVSLLQRKLTIGYSRASRMIEQMEASGILGAHKNAQAREVLISRDEWDAIKAQMAADSGDDETLEDDDGGAVPDEYGDEYQS